MSTFITPPSFLRPLCDSPFLSCFCHLAILKQGTNLHFSLLVRLCFLEFNRASLVEQLVKNPPAMQETQVRFLGREILWRRIGYPLQYSWASMVTQSVENPSAIGETWV